MYFVKPSLLHHLVQVESRFSRLNLTNRYSGNNSIIMLYTILARNEYLLTYNNLDYALCHHRF